MSIETLRTTEEKAGDILEFARKYNADRVTEMVDLFMDEKTPLNLSASEREERINLILNFTEKPNNDDLTVLKTKKTEWADRDGLKGEKFESKIRPDMSDKDRTLYAAAYVELATIFMDIS